MPGLFVIEQTYGGSYIEPLGDLGDLLELVVGNATSTVSVSAGATSTASVSALATSTVSVSDG